MAEYLKKNNIQVNNETNSQIDNISMNTQGIPNSLLADVMAGKTNPTNEMMGHRSSLAPSVEAKMSRAFGMDFSNLQVYKSDVMAGTGTRGMASGNKVVLSSDVNLNSLEGQALIGHELSHIHAQASGEGLGHSGLLNDAALEQKADTEGMMAARGMSIYGETSSMDTGSGMGDFGTLSPMGAGMSTTAGAPMQADKPWRKKKSSPASSPQLANYTDAGITNFMMATKEEMSKGDHQLWEYRNLMYEMSANAIQRHNDLVSGKQTDDRAIQQEKMNWLLLLRKELEKRYPDLDKMMGMTTSNTAFPYKK